MEFTKREQIKLSVLKSIVQELIEKELGFRASKCLDEADACAEVAFFLSKEIGRMLIKRKSLMMRGDYEKNKPKKENTEPN